MPLTAERFGRVRPVAAGWREPPSCSRYKSEMFYFVVLNTARIKYELLFTWSYKERSERTDR